MVHQTYISAILRRERYLKATEELGLLHDNIRNEDSLNPLLSATQDLIVLIGGELEYIEETIKYFRSQRNTEITGRPQ